jgi:hypothetical protein
MRDDVLVKVISVDVRLYASYKSKMAGCIFIMCFIDVMTVEANQESCLLISFVL